jgi:hypothetical protein
VIAPNYGNIAGRVIDFENKYGISQAPIIYYSMDISDYPWGCVFTDEYGNFVISNLPSCTFYIGVDFEWAMSEQYISGWMDPYGRSWREVTVIPNSTVTVNLELRPLPRLIIEPEIQVIPQGEFAKIQISILNFENATWWIFIPDGLGELTIISYYYRPDFQPPPDVIIDSDVIKVEPYMLYLTPLEGCNFTATLNISVDANATCGLYLIPFTLCYYTEVPMTTTYTIVQVVPKNTSIERLEVAQQNYVITIQTNSTDIYNLQFNKSAKKISFDVSGPESTIGYCNVSIPNTLMQAPFNVMVNGQQTPFNIVENSLFQYIYFTYSHSCKTVQISSQTLLSDSEPPLIIPLTDVEEILIEQNVTIYAFVIDFDHEIDGVWLTYSVNGGATWSEPIEMIARTENIYKIQLTSLKEGDVIIYRILAEDEAGNTAESEYYQVQVIPEFPSVLILQLIMLLVLAMVVCAQKSQK